MRRDILTPTLVIGGIVVVILLLWAVVANGQTHTMPGSNVVPSGASLTINSGGSITAAAGSTVTGFGGGGGGNVSNSGTPTLNQLAQWTDATHIQGITTIGNSLLTNSAITIAGTSTSLGGTITQDTITGLSSTGIVKRTAANTLAIATAGTDYAAPDSPLQWDGGSTNLVAATGRTSLGGTTVGQSFFTLTNPSAITFPEISATNVVSAKTAAALKTDLSLTATDVGLGSVTNNAQTQAAIVPNTAPSSGQILVGNVGGTAYAKNTVSGSGATISLGATGVITISAIPNASLSGAPVGAIVGTTDTQTLTNKRVNPRVTSIASNATWSPSADTDDIYEITAQAVAVTTISNPTGTPVDGQSLIIRFKDAGSAEALTWSGTQWEAGPGVTLPTTTVVGRHDYVGFRWNSTTSKWTMLASSQDAAVVNAGTGFTVGGAAASGKILQGNGTNYIASTATWPTTGGTAGYHVKSDGTNYTAYPDSISNSSVSTQSPTTTDVYLAGSNVAVAAGDFKAKGQYHCVFDVTKSAGTGAIVISLRVGTGGTSADTAVVTFTFGAGTAVADTGVFEVWATWRTVGSGTSAVVQSVCRADHNLATTGLISNAATFTIVGTTSAGFNSSTATNIGLSFNGSTAFAGNITMVQAALEQP